MFRFALVLAVTTWALAAHADSATATIAYAQWQSLRDPQAPGIAFENGVHFLAEHPGWPDEKIIRIRTEAAALFERPDATKMVRFCANSPISGRGMFACVRSGASDAPTRKAWVHQGWIQGDFTESEEQSLLSDFGKELTLADHRARIERLLYEQKTNAAKRLFSFDPTNRNLYLARIAVIQQDKRAKALVNGLPTAEKHDPGLLFDRASNAYSDRKFDTVLSIVASVPARAPYPELWWPLRNTAIREALSQHNDKTALAILANRGSLKGEQLAEALWLKGWLSLEARHDAATAYKEFHSLYTNVNTPVSRSRAAFWAARAARRNGNQDIANEWLVKASKYTTVFYGQLAHAILKTNAPLPLPDFPSYTADEKQLFENDELIQIIRMLHADRDTQMRDRFLTYVANTTDSPGRLVLLAQLARELVGVSSGVKVSKLALRKQVVMIPTGWPVIDLPQNLGVEPALALAISRQESEFDPYARSSANARGLMQLLPATAQQIAKRNGWHYDNGSLENPQENLMMGTAYLGQIIRGFDGSYVLGIASYNAGPASVRRWISERGSPPKTLDGTLNWIESIPFGETRNYVMRVLENLQVYRTLYAPDAPLHLPEDLVR